MASPRVLLPAPPPHSLSVTDSYLSLSIINNPPSPPFSPTPHSCAQGALTCCLVLHYQMARQMTSPWPHYTRTHRHNSTLTKQTGCRSKRSKRTSHLNMQTPQTDRWTCGQTAIHRLAHIHWWWIISKDVNVLNIHSSLFFSTHPPRYWLSLSVIIQHSLSSLQSLRDRMWKEEGACLSTSHEKQR